MHHCSIWLRRSHHELGGKGVPCSFAKLSRFRCNSRDRFGPNGSFTCSRHKQNARLRPMSKRFATWPHRHDNPSSFRLDLVCGRSALVRPSLQQGLWGAPERFLSLLSVTFRLIVILIFTKVVLAPESKRFTHLASQQAPQSAGRFLPAVLASWPA